MESGFEVIGGPIKGHAQRKKGYCFFNVTTITPFLPFSP